MIFIMTMNGVTTVDACYLCSYRQKLQWSHRTPLGLRRGVIAPPYLEDLSLRASQLEYFYLFDILVV